MICGGGIMLVLMLIYVVVAEKKKQSLRRNANQIIKSYSEENLRKMEYDVAFYDGDAFKIFRTEDTVRQVTIDEVLGSESLDLSEMTRKAIFSKVEDNGGEVIKGKYNSAE